MNENEILQEIRRVLKPGGQFAVSDIVLLRVLPEKIANNVNAYLGCVAGASLLNEYILMAVEAGLKNLSIPQIVPSKSILDAYGLDPKTTTTGCCLGETSEQGMSEAASAVASVKLHGKKP